MAYDLGETYIVLHDFKSELMQERAKEQAAAQSLKKVDILKCNEYCRLGLAMFTHYASFFSRTNDADPTVFASPAAAARGGCKYLDMTIEEMDARACWSPDESKCALIVYMLL